MTNDEIREALAEQAWGVLFAARREGLTDLSVIAHAIVRNQMPVVRRAQAATLRDAADRIDVVAQDVTGSYADGLDDAAAGLRARADDLDADGPLTGPAAPLPD